MRAEYYESIGWDERGVPRAGALRELQIDEVLTPEAFETLAGDAPSPAASAGQAGHGRPQLERWA
jgi:hypothetical protein